MKLDFHSNAKFLFTSRDIFGEDCVSVKDDSVLSVTVDGKTANINLETRVCSYPCRVSQDIWGGGEDRKKAASGS